MSRQKARLMTENLKKSTAEQGFRDADQRAPDTQLYYQLLEQIIELWKLARRQRRREDFIDFERAVANLSMRFASFPLYDLHQTIASLLVCVKAGISNQQDLKSVVGEIDGLLNRLIKARQQSPDPMLIEFESAQNLDLLEAFSTQPRHQTKTHLNGNTVAVIDDEQSSRLALCATLEQFNYTTHAFASISEFSSSNQPVDLILLDLVLPGLQIEQVFAFAKAQRATGVPVIVCSGLFTMETRLAAVRANVVDFIIKPIHGSAMIEKINRALQPQIAQSYTIVLVDDQEMMGNFYSTVFAQNNIHIDYFSSARALFDSLDTITPDLFLLDMFMPDVNGLEIAAMLRQEEKFDFTPIIFLTSDESVETKLQVLNYGADDVIPKSTPSTLVVKQVLSRLTRSSMISNFVARDALTGVLTHGQIIEAASNVLRLSKRNASHNALVLLDLDNFKMINDTFGHAAGDKVLSALGQQLRSSLRETDYIGRYGGEEFLIVLQGVGFEEAVAKVEGMRESFAKFVYAHASRSFSVTFSGGIVSLNHHKTISAAMNQADKRLYQAKAGGRNRLVSD